MEHVPAKYLTTKRGDTGKTTIGGEQVVKDSPIIMSISALALCQSRVALAEFNTNNEVAKAFCAAIVCALYAVMGEIHKQRGRTGYVEDLSEHMAFLEEFLEVIEVPKVNFFIRPHPKNVFLMDACNQIRCAETIIAGLDECDALKQYINRLSDCFHALALYVLNEKQLQESNVKHARPLEKKRSVDIIGFALFGLLMLMAIVAVFY